MGRLYVLCSNKLDPIYAAVQGGHAVAQFMMDQQEGIDNYNRSAFREDKWYNDTVVYLSTDVNKWNKYLYEFKNLWYYYSTWYEPDVDNELTSIALHIPEDLIDIKTNKLKNYEGSRANGDIIPRHKELLRRLKSEKLLGLHSLDKELEEFIENPKE